MYACVISFHKVLKLGLANQLVHNAQSQKGNMMVGDGSKVPCKGLIQGFKVEILPEHSIKVDALVLDVPEIAYEFLFGRIAMAKIGIHADLGKSRWFVSDGFSNKPLEVFYTDPYATNDKCESSSCYIVNDDPDSSNVEKTITIPDEEKFKKLFDQIQNNDLLSLNQKEALIALIKSKSQAFGTGFKDLTQTNLLKFHVNTGDALPVYKRPYQNMSHSELEQLRIDIGQMVECGVLIPAMHSKVEAPNSGWSFQVMYVPKKNGEKRLVTMFQDLNKVTVRDTWPLPVITNIIESFAGSKWLSSVDLLKGFHQIAVDEQSVPKLTIATPFGNYSYTVLPFGILNGPSTFSRCIYLALQEFIPEFCAVYIDDCQIFSSSFEEHMVHFEKVVDRMIEVNM